MGDRLIFRFVAGAVKRYSRWDWHAPPAGIRSHGFVLTPGRYVGAAAADDDDVPFEERFAALTAKLEEQFAESDALTQAIRRSLARVED